MERALLRILDANYNRLKEALKVSEDILRFSLEDRDLTFRLKKIRHKFTEIIKKEGLLRESLLSRNSIKDIGKNSHPLELNRKNLKDIFSANFQRAKESSRVLEEIYKIINKKKVYKIKELRYNLYSLEKSVEKRWSSLLNSR